MRVRGTITYTRSPEATAREMRLALKAANAFVVTHWHRRMMPGHFTVAGGRKYGYQKRQGDDQPPLVPPRRLANRPAARPGRTRALVLNPAYSWRKRRKWRHNRPLVWSGQAERMARRMVRITSSSKKGAAIMTLPRYFYAYRKDDGQPDKAGELTRVTREEAGRLAKLHDLFITRRLREFRAPRQQVRFG